MARQIPLFGFALDALKLTLLALLNITIDLDALSAVLVKYLRENKLLPTNLHSTYSLRHSFQDRLTAVNTLDRIQADLMGHKFNRPVCGIGATLRASWSGWEKCNLNSCTVTCKVINH
jgi:hypothetical protein